MSTVQVKGDTQAVAPVHPVPPHCAYCAASALEVELDTTELEVFVELATVDVDCTVVADAVDVGPDEPESEQLKTEGPGMV